MKKWSIRAKLTMLSVVLLSFLGVLGFTSLKIQKSLTEAVEVAVETDLPSVRNMTLIDMMHDGLRAVVYHSILVSDSGSQDKKNEVAQELKEFSAKLLENIEKIENLKITDDIRNAIKEAKPEINAYSVASGEIVGLALSGQKTTAISKLENFQNSFESLEEKLEVLGDLIEKGAENSKINSAHKAQDAKTASIFVLIFGFLFGAIFSWWMSREIVATLSQIIEGLSKSSQLVSSASVGSASAATILSEASTEQAASLQQTMSSVEEISAMVNQNSESAVKVKNSMDANQLATEDGSRSVSEMLEAISEIKETNFEILNQMETSNKEFGDIVKIISDIGEKTKVINEIVFQTKLLSFNASVEAARAGEHGKGFAVVAEEVGNLAQMSGNAAKEITDMLSNSIKKVNDIVEVTKGRVDQLVETGKDKIAMGQSRAEKCQESLRKINENAKAIASMTSEIANASKEQAQGIHEINKAVSHLDQVTQQNASVAQQSSTQAEELKSQAIDLEESVESLVLFVEGAKEDIKSQQSFTGESKNTKQQAGFQKVLQFKNQKSQSVKTSSNSHQSHKKAVGQTDSIPDSNDPNFEEY